MYKVSPTTPSNDRKKAQLSFFKESDPSVIDILTSASHCALYSLQTTKDNKHSWQKSDIEGSLYVLKRNRKPTVSFVIRNQSGGGEDFVQEITDKVEIEIKDQTVFYKIGKHGKVHGLWFNNQDALQKFVKCIQTIPKEEDPGKALMSLIKKEVAVAPIAPPQQLETRNVISAPAAPPTAPLSVHPAEVADDALSILKERIGLKDSTATGKVVMPQVKASPLPPTIPGVLSITKTDLRLVLADIVSSDAFINEVYEKLLARQAK